MAAWRLVCTLHLGSCAGPLRRPRFRDGASRMKSGLDRVSLLAEHDQLLEMMVVGAQQGRRVCAVPLVLPARDEEVLDVALAVDAPELALARRIGLDHKELVADVLAFHRV